MYSKRGDTMRSTAALVAVVFLALWGFVSYPSMVFPLAVRSISGAFDVEIIPNKVYPGSISRVIITKKSNQNAHLLEVRYKGQLLPLVEDKGRYWCLLGIGLDEAPGKRLISLVYRLGDHDSKDIENVVFEIDKKEYPKEFLRVSKKMVEFPKHILKRVLDDQSAIRSAVSKVESIRYFDGPFIRPVQGKVKSAFGLRRYFNNKPRSPHSGVDLAAPEGTPVLACNSGRVVLVRDCYLSGKTVVIDHGLGLYSLYAHLDKVLVRPGQMIKKGEKIALSGMSGRATGPHLHWGISLYGSRLDPIALLKIF